MESLKIQDYMNKHPVVFMEKMPVAEAVEKLLATKQTGGPVIDKAGKMIGFLSEQDCIKKMIESSYYRQQSANVEDIMTASVKTVKAYDSVLFVAEKLMSDRPKIYPVIDDNGDLVGAIDRSAILRAIDLHLQDGYKAH